MNASLWGGGSGRVGRVGGGLRLESQDDITPSLWQETRGAAATGSVSHGCMCWLRWSTLNICRVFFLLFFFFATVSLECQCDCWLLISSKTGNGFARSLLLHSRRLTTTRLFLFEWKWHESEDESVSLKNWEDSKWLEGAWHRMCREALLFLLPVSFTCSLQEVITFLPQRLLISSHGALILHLFTQQTQWWVILEGTTL